MRFRALASALPSQVVTNDMIIDRVREASRDALSAADLKLLVRRTQALFDLARTQTRYYRAPDETALGLGISVGRDALQQAGMEPEDIDLLIYVGVARGYIEPATANLFQAHLGLVRATCFDLLDACASWLRAVHIARTFMLAGVYKRVMVLNAECNTREFGNFRFSAVEELRYRFPGLSIGEAATATILEADDSEDDRFYATFRNSGQDHGLCRIPLPNHQEYDADEDTSGLKPLEFFSDGERLFRTALDQLVVHYRSDCTLRTFRSDIAFSHAASDSLTERVSRELGIAPVYLTHARFGNTVSASVPLAMTLARREQVLQPGTNVLIGCASAGITTAWACFRYLD
jgi:3-oxoacyl-[acyl-carrier-protein] synthase III